MKDFNAGYMENRLKKGWTISDIIQDLETTEGEFYNGMSKRFSKKLRKFYKARLEQNQKRRDKVSNPNSQKVVIFETEENVAIQPQVDENSFQLIPEEVGAVKNEDVLEELKLREEQIKKEISQKEDQKYFLSSKIREKQNVLEKQEFLLKELYDELNHINTEIGEARRKISDYSHSIAEVEIELTDRRETLLQIQDKIKDLEMVTIFIYASGEITTFEGVEVAIPVTWENIYKAFKEDEALENLTFKQTKLLAKVIALVRNSDKKFEIIFEVDELQTVFDKLL